MCYNRGVDERAFTQQRQEAWKHLSDTLDQAARRGPRSLPADRLRSLGAEYRALVSDLAFARTQGASEGLITYLNELAGRAHGVIYAARAARARNSLTFLIREFPALFRSTSRYTLVAALIFFLGWGAAAYLIATEPQSAESFIPEHLTARDSSGESAGAPDPAGLSSHIMTNNIRVGIYAFAAGVTAGLLTVFVLFSNGLLIGAVASVIAPATGQLRFWSLILPHGVIELMAIFICGGAGLMAGSSIIAPGNLRRADALRLAAGTALRLFAGTLPFFVIAAIVEGFITPSVLPAWSKLSFAALTAIALALYLGFAGRSHASQGIDHSSARPLMSR